MHLGRRLDLVISRVASIYSHVIFKKAGAQARKPEDFSPWLCEVDDGEATLEEAFGILKSVAKTKEDI